MNTRYWLPMVVFALCLTNAQAGAETSEHDKAHHPHWGYQGNTGPAHWGDALLGYSECKLGNRQSPIDFSAGLQAGTHKPFTFDYRPSRYAVSNNGHTIISEEEQGQGRLNYDGNVFVLKQFHLHAPSEHTVDGKHYPMELHLVHQSAAGVLTVVGIFIREGHENQPLAEMFRHLPSEGSASRTLEIDLTKVVPDQKEAFEYLGSLTTPPCSEEVNWIVLRQPMELSADQIKAFRKQYSDNARPVQPANKRTVNQ